MKKMCTTLYKDVGVLIGNLGPLEAKESADLGWSGSPFSISLPRRLLLASSPSPT